MDDKVFASATMTAAMTDDPSEYESIPTVNVFDTDQGNDLADKQAGGNRTGILKALPVGAFVLVPVDLGFILFYKSLCLGGKSSALGKSKTRAEREQEFPAKTETLLPRTNNNSSRKSQETPLRHRSVHFDPEISELAGLDTSYVGSLIRRAVFVQQVNKSRREYRLILPQSKGTSVEVSLSAHQNSTSWTPKVQ